jgi:hypothetical protein
MTHQIQFRTSYSQFYIYDKGSPIATDSNEFWTDEAHDARLAVEEGILGVSIETYSNVRAILELLEHQPDIDKAHEYDHIVEASLEFKSEALQLLNCPNSTVEFELAIKPDFYRVRVYSANLDSVTDEDEEANDFYLIQLWPESYAERKVLKQYTWPQ